ncbi:hypothetical protein EV182_006191 [Spiromyces aspiralis]|uniref:Uncharacterized protein n=1 Tax=Spiromyces aspiralis TaxID=68401 RepID=A0ACC1HMK7_9FUNG|nr:hypothetical protein EV182_006191 [Spiromyces aspiralis]
MAADNESEATKLTKKQLKALKFKHKHTQKTDASSAKVAEKGSEGEASQQDDYDSDSSARRSKAATESKPKHKTRFIVFNTTKPTTGILIGPASVRLLTDKKTQKPKGYAFLEFEQSKMLKKALMYHRMPFKSRKINVELTAGGGGNNENRRKKLEKRRNELEKERDKKGKRARPGQGDGDDEDDNNGDNLEGPVESAAAVTGQKKARNRRPKKKVKRN